MRHPAYRLRKYDAKMDPTTIAARFTAHRATMNEQEESIFGELVLIESKAKIVCEDAGIPSGNIPMYLNFARQCWKYAKKFSGVTKDNEILFWFNHWISRGLNPTVLANEALLCGTTIAGYEASL